MVFRMRKLGCTKERVIKARFLSRAHYRNRSNTGLLNFPEENGRDINELSESNNASVLKNIEKAKRGGQDSFEKRGFWLSDSSGSKKSTEETSEDLSSKLESLLKPIKP